jgi:predicted DCC family thiol-disulfide oxidoreductase YuxK
MKKLFLKYSALYDKEIDGRGLAVFRICFSLILLADVTQMFFFRHLMFDKVPYMRPNEIDMWPLLLFWWLALALLSLGLFTRISSLINYLLTTIVFGTIDTYEYHMIYTYQIISLLFVFLPISRDLSLDRLLLKLKYSNTKFRYVPSKNVSVLAYYIPVALGIGFVYLDSVCYKYVSPLWLKGLGVWLPASIPQAVFFKISPILNAKYLIVFLGYLTLAFETIFMFVFWRKRWRVATFVTGLGLHLGILICFPIPFFALGISAIYLLLLPVRVWSKVFSRSEKLHPKLKFYYDAECPLCNRARIVISHFNSSENIKFLTVQGSAELDPNLQGITMDSLLTDIHSVDDKGRVYVGLDTYIQVLNAIWYLKLFSLILRLPIINQVGKAVYKYVAENRTLERCTEDNCGYEIPVLPADEGKMKILTNFTIKDMKVRAGFAGLIFLSVLQAIVSYNSPIVKEFKKFIHIDQVGLVKGTESLAKAIGKTSKTLFGITNHAVFVDSHFQGYNHSIAITFKSSDGRTLWLPITDPDGTPGQYQLGPVWAKWGFRVNRPNINQLELNEGLRDFTAFWAHKNGYSLDHAVFQILVKKNDAPTEWEKDFLDRQLANPWLDAGTVTWHDKAFSSHVKVIEEL